MVRAGWSFLKFSASKLSHADSTSGPSATSQPIPTNTSAMRSASWVSGWRAPRGLRSHGSVTSTASSTSTRCVALQHQGGVPLRRTPPGPRGARRSPACPRRRGSGPGSDPSSRRASSSGARSPRCAGLTAASAARSAAAANAVPGRGDGGGQRVGVCADVGLPSWRPDLWVRTRRACDIRRHLATCGSPSRPVLRPIIGRDRRRRAPTLAYRHTAAAVARLRLSARPWIGDPDAVVGLLGHGRRNAVRLATEYPGDGPGEQRRDRRVVQVELAAGVGDEQSSARPRGTRRARRRRRARGRSARWNTEPVEARTRLAVVRVDGVAREHDRVGARGVGDPHDGARVAGVGDRDAHGDEPTGRRASARSSGTSSRSQTAKMPCGVTVSERLAAARSVIRTTGAGAERARDGAPRRRR